MRILFLIIALSLTSVSYSQDIALNDISKSPMHKTVIDPDNEFVSGYTPINLNLRINNHSTSYSKHIIDYEGNVMFLDNVFGWYIVKIDNQDISIFTPPGERWFQPHSSVCVTKDGRKAVYSSGDNTLSVLDINSKQIIYQHSFEEDGPAKIEWIRINDDASLIFSSGYFDWRYSAYIFKLNGETYDIYEAGKYQKTNYPFISSLDNRVYFILQAPDYAYEIERLGYIDPKIDNYKTFVDTPLPEMNGDYVELIDIVEQGKVFILSVGQNSARIKQTVHYYSVYMIDDTHFGEPSLIGDVVLDPYYDDVSRWPTTELISYASESGRVLIAQVLKRVRMDQYYYYDAYAFLKNPAGKWIKKQINPSNEDIKDRMLLSCNGRCLYWNRWPLASVTNYQFK